MSLNMKWIKEQSYYEVLEVSPNATVKEIQRAYERARETFRADSLAIYTLFTKQETEEIQAAIEEAYRVLIDEALRKSYNQAYPRLPAAVKEERPPEVERFSQEDKSPLSFTDISIELGEVAYRGKTLKQLREKLGIDLATLSEETKIAPRVLEWIEEEVVEKLPALVYLKGFLRAYARCLSLDPQSVVEGYLNILAESKKK